MSSKTAPNASWSLTRRMALTFAVTTSIIVLLFGAGSVYQVFDNIRDDVKDYMEHELNELGLNLRLAGGDRADFGKEIDKLIAVNKKGSCAFRIRDLDGELLEEGGAPGLLKAFSEPVELGTSWRKYLFSKQIAVASERIDTPPAHIEIIANTEQAQRELGRYVASSIVTFLVSVVLAALAGYWMVNRGLRGLRIMVDQARDIEISPVEQSTIQLDDAPVEVREVGVALNMMLGRIHRGLTDMRSFTAGLAHELRSPLQNLIGETEVTLLSERSKEEYQSLLRSNLEDLHGLSDAVDNLVVYCRNSDPSDRLRTRESFELAVEAKIRIDRLRRSAAAVGVDLRVEVEGDTWINADRESCLRIVRNLVANAVEWSPRGELVLVTFKGTTASVRIEVRDHGPGVPAELSRRLFEPFVSGHRTVGRRAGYGLGLAICRSAVDDHGGVIRHQSAPEGGTIFVVELPRDGHGPINAGGGGDTARRSRWSAREIRTAR